MTPAIFEGRFLYAAPGTMLPVSRSQVDQRVVAGLQDYQ
jgi:hypothetical protein